MGMEARREGGGRRWPAEGARWGVSIQNSKMKLLLLAVLAMMATAAAPVMSKGVSMELRTMYRYSEEFRSAREKMGMATAPAPAPLMDGEEEAMMNHEARDKLHGKVKNSKLISYAGTLSFYEKLLRHDRRRHRRLVDATTSVVSLSPSNRTTSIESLGGLHYAIVTIGSPSKEFLVALDTGSDLLWVPCDCIQCAKPDWSLYGVQGLPEFAIYSPSNSSTSKIVQCNDTQVCVSTLSPGICARNSDPCTYNAAYLSANTSSSGYLVQDILHLNSELSPDSTIQSTIYFGCGRIQTGDFLDLVPNGLFGLGPEVYSVPSTLAATSLTPNVFSICFNENGTSGRLIFGKEPSSTYSQTPIYSSTPRNLYYILEVSSFRIENSTIPTSTLPIIFDTGTSITILDTTLVTEIADSISNTINVQYSQIPFNNGEFTLNCWSGRYINVDTLPPLRVVFAGGNEWEVPPYGAVVDQSGNLIYLCLFIVGSTQYNIIGYNFMYGYEYFFDQDSKVFSWVPSNCMNSTSQDTLLPSSLPAPAPSTSRNSSIAPSSPALSKAHRTLETTNIGFIMISSVMLSYYMSFNPFVILNH